MTGHTPGRKKDLELAEKYGLGGSMIGRVIFKNPFAMEKEPKDNSTTEYLYLQDQTNEVCALLDNFEEKCEETEETVSRNSYSLFLFVFESIS